MSGDTGPGGGEPSTAYQDFLSRTPGTDLAVVHLGADAVHHVFFTEPMCLVPSAYVEELAVGVSTSWGMLMTAAWDGMEAMQRLGGVGPALSAQLLVALGGNPLRAGVSPRRHVHLALLATEGFEEHGSPLQQGRAYLELGVALGALRRVSDAMTALERARALLERAGDDHGLRAVHARTAGLMTRLGLPEQALLRAEEGMRIGARLEPKPSRGQTFVTGYLHHQRVQALTDLGLLDDADRALEDWRADAGSDRDVHDLLRSTAELRDSQGRPTEALACYVQAVDARFARPTADSLAGRSFFLERSAHLVGRAVGAALQAHRPDLAVGVLAAVGRGGRGPLHPGAAAQHELRHRVGQLTRSATAAVVAGDRAELDHQENRARELLETWQSQAGGQQGAQPARTVAELAEALPRAVRAGELALWYGRSDQGDGMVLAVRDGAVFRRSIALPAAELERLAALARDECLRRSGTEGLDRLGAAVLDPVADLLAGVGRVFVTAQGVLEEFPFHAAPFRGEPLVVSAEVRSLPSLAHLLRRGPGTAPQRAGGAVVGAVRSPRYELLPDLPAVHAEADAVRAVFPGTTVLHGDEATAAAVLGSFATADLLHLAGHAAFGAREPNLARILLADRPLFAFEIACAPRVPRLVNISGCRAGAEHRTLGGEGEGLPSAFLAAGAEVVVAPLWPVRDDAALLFNRLLYPELARSGGDLAQAARNAQLAVRKYPDYSHPGFWGGFTVQGAL
ncbi:hypothetical protein TR51_11210 [Kitasatospora griseola]|uniref:CHAT domain-containing protein n=1 Tax=Kitasatospora griseola TaxID=2064 RepID=A0A0D0PQE7_KITGR|nr:CHAT domain-containing protein [Kitasatospora griseola]KIQ64734.1 hypothetical protein TR51_11210 [Kitasatospora griseola]